MLIEQQPVSARFGDTTYLNDFITPQNPDIASAYASLTRGLTTPIDRIKKLWKWVADIPYRPHIRAKLNVDGKSIVQDDLWTYPHETIQIGIANCFNKSTLLCSLLANEPIDARIALGNLKLDGVGGHAWCIITLGDKNFYLETTQPHLPSPFIEPVNANIYETVIVFNTTETEYLGGKLEEPLGVCCVKWLEDYLSQRYCTTWL